MNREPENYIQTCFASGHHPKLPFKFYYRFKDDSGKSSRLMIEDWKIGALYWNCLKAAEGNQSHKIP